MLRGGGEKKNTSDQLTPAGTRKSMEKRDLIDSSAGHRMPSREGSYHPAIFPKISLRYRAPWLCGYDFSSQGVHKGSIQRASSFARVGWDSQRLPRPVDTRCPLHFCRSLADVVLLCFMRELLENRFVSTIVLISQEWPA